MLRVWSNGNADTLMWGVKIGTTALQCLAVTIEGEHSISMGQ